MIDPPKYLAATGVDNPFFQTIGKIFGGATNSPANTNNAAVLITTIIEIVLFIVGFLAVLFLIVGGYRYVTAHGNEEQAEAAKKTITTAIWGLVVVILAFAIVRVITLVLLEGTAGAGTP